MARRTPPPPTKFSTRGAAQPKMSAAANIPPTTFGPGNVAGQNAIAQRKPGVSAGMLAAPQMAAARAQVAPPPTQFSPQPAQAKAGEGFNLVVGAYMHPGANNLPPQLAGHAFVGIERPDGRQQTFGFSPKESYNAHSDLARLSGGVPGKVYGEAGALSKPGVHVTKVPVSERQAMAALRKVDQYRNQSFNATNRQCTNFASDVAGAAGVRVNVPAGQPRAFYNAVGLGGTVQGRFQSAVLQMKGNSFALPNSFRLPAGPGKPLPENVRSKMENFYNTDFSGVRVHVGPEAPAIGALAFTVGDTIVFAPGQYDPVSTRGQQILGHELAHVVQQRAGRVHNPYGSNLAVVQDNALEAEADRLGQRAAMGIRPGVDYTPTITTHIQSGVLRFENPADTNAAKHLVIGTMCKFLPGDNGTPKLEHKTIIIEVLEPCDSNYQAQGARDKIDIIKKNYIDISNNTAKNEGYFDLCLVFGINKEADINNKKHTEQLDKLQKECNILIKKIKNIKPSNGVSFYCVCIPFLFKKTKDAGGYTFPFYEARALLTLYAGSTYNNSLFVGDKFVRSMDSDVTDDYLLTLSRSVNGKEINAEAILTTINHYEECNADIVGGYKWNVNDINKVFISSLVERSKGKIVNSKFLSQKINMEEVIEFSKELLSRVNDSELQCRSELTEIRHTYYVEPNTITSLDYRLGGARKLVKAFTSNGEDVQQREGFFYREHSVNSDRKITFNPLLYTNKPIKNYLDDFIISIINYYYNRIFNNDASYSTDIIFSQALNIRQTHLNKDTYESTTLMNPILKTGGDSINYLEENIINRCDEILKMKFDNLTLFYTNKNNAHNKH